MIGEGVRTPPADDLFSFVIGQTCNHDACNGRTDFETALKLLSLYTVLCRGGSREFWVEKTKEYFFSRKSDVLGKNNLKKISMRECRT